MSAAGETPTLPVAAQRLEGENFASIVEKGQEYILHVIVDGLCLLCLCVQAFHGRTFKGDVVVRAQVLWTYVQGVPDRTSKGALKDGE